MTQSLPQLCGYWQGDDESQTQKSPLTSVDARDLLPYN